METEAGHRNEIEVVCGVIRDDSGRYLICRRPVGKHLGGLWEFPGGKVDAGEVPAEALARELHEELEIRVEIGERLADVRWDYGDTVIRLMPFLCRILSGNARPIEHAEIRWSRSGEWRELSWAPADGPVVDELILREFMEKESVFPPEKAC